MGKKLAIIGCGRISKKHFQVLKNYNNNFFSIVAFCDNDNRKNPNVLLKSNIPFFSDIHEMSKSVKIDIFVILTPSGSHLDIAIDLLKYNKDFIIEKPIDLKINKVQKFIKLTKNKKINTFIVKQNRFNLPIVKLKKLLDMNGLGKIFLATIRMRWCRDQKYYDLDKWRKTNKMDGGVLTNQAIHHIDMLQWLNGQVISAKSYTKSPNVKIETNDTVIGILKFKNNSLGIIEATNATRPNDLEGSISLLGEKGSVEIGGFAMNKIITWNVNNFSYLKKYKKFNENPKDVYGYGHVSFYKFIENFYNKKTNNFLSPQEALKSLKIAIALNKAAKIKGEFKI